MPYWEPMGDNMAVAGVPFSFWWVAFLRAVRCSTELLVPDLGEVKRVTGGGDGPSRYPSDLLSVFEEGVERSPPAETDRPGRGGRGRGVSKPPDESLFFSLLRVLDPVLEREAVGGESMDCVGEKKGGETDDCDGEGEGGCGRGREGESD